MGERGPSVEKVEHRHSHDDGYARDGHDRRQVDACKKEKQTKCGGFKRSNLRTIIACGFFVNCCCTIVLCDFQLEKRQ